MSTFPQSPADPEPGAGAPEAPVGVPDTDDGAEQGVAAGEPAPLDPDDTEH